MALRFRDRYTALRPQQARGICLFCKENTCAMTGKTNNDTAGRVDRPLFGAIGWTLVFACTGFAACAGWFMLASHAPVLAEEGGRPAFRLAVKSALFTALALLALWRPVRTRPRVTPDAPVTETRPSSRQGWAWLGGALALAALMVLPRLYAYPHAEPDEIHHLIVARNLAVHGVYATGHPAIGFEKFDDYDSVGPPVILPIAAVFKMTGVSLAGARGVMALYSLVLCVALFVLLRPIIGARSAALGVVLMTFAFGSVYLARALYGEVPALFYITLALMRGARRSREHARSATAC